jgi:hypothetical protein
MLRFATKTFEKSFRPTLGADFMKKIVKIEDQEYCLQLWYLNQSRLLLLLGLLL